MSDFIILTDSSADLSGEMAQAADVQVLPLTFTIGGADYHNYPDNREMDPHLFYQRLRAGEVATTAAVNMNQYVEAIEPLLQAGRDVLVLAFSSGLSATFQSSKLAVEELSEKYPERKLYTVDTLCASLGQGLLVWYAAQERKKGRTIEEVRDWAEANKLSLCHQFTVDDLHFLKRGGRISATTAVVGSMLQIKPVLHVDDEGHLINIGKARGRQSSLKALVDKMEKTVTEAGKQTVFISHGDCLEDAEAVAQMVRERFGTQDIRINYVGPVIGAHSGPGTLALFLSGHSALSQLLFSSQRSVSMDEIKWLEVAVNTTPDRLDEVTAKLTAAGMTGLVIEDEGEFQQFLEQNRQYWDYVDQELMDRMRGVTRVKFYVTDDGAGRVQLEQYTRGLDAEYTVTP